MLDRRERTYDPEETIRLFLRSLQSTIWTGLPGQIITFYPAIMCADVQPALNCLFTNSQGVALPVQLPLLSQVPCQFPGGGGAMLTWTPQPGDECFLVFGSRSIDSWWTQGFKTPNAVDGITGRPVNTDNTPIEQRMHNLSDAVALLGFFNKTRAYAPLAGGLQLQTDDGTAYVQLNPATHAVNIVASAVTITTTGVVNINGAQINSMGEVTDKLGKVLGTHEHSGVTTGGGVTGPPV